MYILVTTFFPSSQGNCHVSRLPGRGLFPPDCLVFVRSAFASTAVWRGEESRLTGMRRRRKTMMMRMMMVRMMIMFCNSLIVVLIRTRQQIYHSIPSPNESLLIANIQDPPPNPLLPSSAPSSPFPHPSVTPFRYLMSLTPSL